MRHCTLSGFKSRCMNPRMCSWSTAMIISAAYTRASICQQTVMRSRSKKCWTMIKSNRSNYTATVLNNDQVKQINDPTIQHANNIIRNSELAPIYTNSNRNHHRRVRTSVNSRFSSSDCRLPPGTYSMPRYRKSLSYRRTGEQTTNNPIGETTNQYRWNTRPKQQAIQ